MVVRWQASGFLFLISESAVMEVQAEFATRIVEVAHAHAWSISLLESTGATAASGSAPTRTNVLGVMLVLVPRPDRRLELWTLLMELTDALRATQVVIET